MPRPNIVFILADDMGYGDFSCFNGGLSQTPTLDRLAEEGVCLTQHYSASPVCAPARAALLTGRYPHRTGAIDTLELRGLDRIHLDERTFADHLRVAGYATGLVGKWHNGALDQRYHPNQRGFDEFVGFSGGWSPVRRLPLRHQRPGGEERRPLHDGHAHRRGHRLHPAPCPRRVRPRPRLQRPALPIPRARGRSGRLPSQWSASRRP